MLVLASTMVLIVAYHAADGAREVASICRPWGQP